MREKRRKKSEINKKKKSGAAGTRTHGRGSVPLVSKLNAILGVYFDKNKKYI